MSGFSIVKGQLVAMSTITPPTVKRGTRRRRATVANPTIYQKEVPVTKATPIAVGSLTPEQFAEAVKTLQALGVIPAAAPVAAPAPVASVAAPVGTTTARNSRFPGIGGPAARTIIGAIVPDRLYDETSPLWRKQSAEVKAIFTAAKLELKLAVAAADIDRIVDAQQHLEMLDQQRANRSLMYKVQAYDTVEEAEAFVRSL